MEGLVAVTAWHVSSVRKALSLTDQRGLDEILHKTQLIHLDWLGLACVDTLGTLAIPHGTQALVCQT